MNNNKGYYSWIHSMKQAAIEAQRKGYEMRRLHEESSDDSEEEARSSNIRTKKGTIKPQLIKQILRMGGIDNAGKRPYSLEDFIEIHKQAAAEGEPVPHSPKDMYQAYLQGLAHQRHLEMSRTRHVAKQDMEPTRVDHNADGEVDGEDQAHRAEALHLSQAPTPVQAPPPPTTTMPSFPWAHQGGMPTPVVHDAPQFDSSAEAEAEVSRLNAERRAQTGGDANKEFHMQQATNAAKEAVAAVRKKGGSFAAQKKAASKAVEDYKNLVRQERSATPPPRYIEDEGAMMEMEESLTTKINRILNG